MPSPDSFGPTKEKHIRVLEHRFNYLYAKYATGDANDFDMAEIAALGAAIADLKELYIRPSTGRRECKQCTRDRRDRALARKSVKQEAA